MAKKCFYIYNYFLSLANLTFPHVETFIIRLLSIGHNVQFEYKIERYSKITIESLNLIGFYPEFSSIQWCTAAS